MCSGIIASFFRCVKSCPPIEKKNELSFTDALYCYGIKTDIWDFDSGSYDDQIDEDILYGDIDTHWELIQCLKNQRTQKT